MNWCGLFPEPCFFRHALEAAFSACYVCARVRVCTHLCLALTEWYLSGFAGSC